MDNLNGVAVMVEGFAGDAKLCKLQVSRYWDGRPRIGLTGADGPFGTLTTNVDGVNLKEDEIIVKTWSENEHWYAHVLITCPFLEDTGKRVKTGFCEAQIWRVLK